VAFPYDVSFKLMAEEDPRGLLELLGVLPSGSNAEVVLLERELALPKLAVDQCFRITAEGESWIEHIECQSWFDSGVPEIIAVYKLTTWHKYRLEVRSVLVLPVEKGASRIVRNTFELDQPELRMTVRFRIVKLWEIDASVALNPKHPRLLPLVPLMKSTAIQIEEAAGQIARLQDSNLANRLGILTGLRYDEVETARLLERIRNMFPDELLMQSSIFNRLKRQVAEEARQEGKREGKQEGRLVSGRQALRSVLAKLYPAISLPDLDSVANPDVLDALLQSVLSAGSEDEVRVVLSRLSH